MVSKDGDDARRLKERTDFFLKIAEELFETGVFPNDLIVLRGKRIPLLATGYFILNDCYKAWRIEKGHFTQEPKIAALTSLAIMTFEPFRPVKPEAVASVAEAKCNEIFALNCAAAILGFPIEPDTNVKIDFWYRLLDVVTASRCQTLEPFRVDMNYQIRNELSSYVRPVHDDDKPGINSLITIFELLSDKHKKSST